MCWLLSFSEYCINNEIFLHNRSVQSLSHVLLCYLMACSMARLPRPLLTPGACASSCPSGWWCYPPISSSVTPFSCLQSFPASGSFPISQFFASGGQRIGSSTLVLPMNIQNWFLLWLTGLIALQWKLKDFVNF